VLALGLGGYLVTVFGPQQVFVLYGLVGLLAIPLAMRLPPLRHAVGDDTVAAEKRWAPSPLNLLFFVVSLGADGVFTATLSILLADVVPVSSALIGAGLLLALNRVITIVLALTGGPIADRYDAQRLLLPCSIAIALGLFAVAANAIYLGAVVLIVARSLFATVAPMVAAARSPDRIGAIAGYATWSDLGLAAGAFLGILAVEWAGASLTYGALGLALLAAIAWQMQDLSRPA
jgi:hypothetical protein